jgi:hypothetical protein
MVKNDKYKSPEDMPIISGGGYGVCATCGCAGFTGTGTICTRCGHNYSEHW